MILKQRRQTIHLNASLSVQEQAIVDRANTVKSEMDELKSVVENGPDDSFEKVSKSGIFTKFEGTIGAAGFKRATTAGSVNDLRASKVDGGVNEYRRHVTPAESTGFRSALHTASQLTFGLVGGLLEHLAEPAFYLFGGFNTGNLNPGGWMDVVGQNLSAVGDDLAYSQDQKVVTYTVGDFSHEEAFAFRPGATLLYTKTEPEKWS